MFLLDYFNKNLTHSWFLTYIRVTIKKKQPWKEILTIRKHNYHNL